MISKRIEVPVSATVSTYKPEMKSSQQIVFGNDDVIDIFGGNIDDTVYASPDRPEKKLLSVNMDLIRRESESIKRAFPQIKKYIDAEYAVALNGAYPAKTLSSVGGRATTLSGSSDLREDNGVLVDYSQDIGKSFIDTPRTSPDLVKSTASVENSINSVLGVFKSLQPEIRDLSYFDIVELILSENMIERTQEKSGILPEEARMSDDPEYSAAMSRDLSYAGWIAYHIKNLTL